ncbi:MAG: aspartate-semialdehyde dehydrogenase [bacterium]
MNRVGFVGWRGMVGSVLLQRMIAEGDFARIGRAVFFTTSQAGRPGPDIGRETSALVDADDLDALAEMDVIVTCQGGDYTAAIHPQLRGRGWRGYWIDAASTLRLEESATIVLDPVNLPVIEQGLADGHRDFIGGNCTVSLMMMALDGLFNADLVEWMTVATYQAISGGGARQMREFLAQMGHAHRGAEALLADGGSSILAIDQATNDALRGEQAPTAEIGFPLANSLLPWVDRDLQSGVSREEMKGLAETNKILGKALGQPPSSAPIPIESTCVRVGVLRCHSQAFTIKLKQVLAEDEIGEIIARGNDWVKLVPNDRAQTLARLTPAAVTGTLDIAVGRVRRLNLGGDGECYLSAFTVGDQLLWGAAEPLRRMLRILARR